MFLAWVGTRFAFMSGMKTNQKNQFVFLGLFLQLAALVLTGCGSNGSNNATTTTPAAYYQSNGQCYNSANQIVPYTYCSATGLGTNGYTYINGMCYQGSTPVATTLCTQSGIGSGYQMLNGQCYTSTGQVVAINLCQGSTIGVGTGIGTGVGVGAQVCYGYYYSPQYGMGMCYGSPDNCAGYTMIPVNPSTGQATGTQVYCQ
jgi:hypothetical protein